ncbi:MAG: sortase, partial [Actinobacteria bacterium]|nr:sortase [Actinomycetota bacterium]
ASASAAVAEARTSIAQPAGDIALPTPTASPDPYAALPALQRVVYPLLAIDSRVVPVGVTAAGLMDTPDFAVGHIDQSAQPGLTGNVVLAAHNDIAGALFRRLTESELGDTVVLYRGATAFTYEVQFQTKVWEQGAPRREREANARFLLPTRNPICTLITCMPLWVDTHRWIVRAVLRDVRALPSRRSTEA